MKPMIAIKWKGEWTYSGHRLTGVRNGMAQLKETYASGLVRYSERPVTECRIIEGEELSELSLENVEHVHPLPASGEDELGDKFQTKENAANTAAGSGLHDASCSHSSLGIGVKMRLMPPAIWVLEIRGDAAALGMFSDSAGNVIWHQIPSSDLPDNLVRVENGKMIRVFNIPDDIEV